MKKRARKNYTVKMSWSGPNSAMENVAPVLHRPRYLRQLTCLCWENHVESVESQRSWRRRNLERILLARKARAKTWVAWGLKARSGKLAYLCCLTFDCLFSAFLWDLVAFKASASFRLQKSADLVARMEKPPFLCTVNPRARSPLDHIWLHSWLDTAGCTQLAAWLAA